MLSTEKPPTGAFEVALTGKSRAALRAPRSRTTALGDGKEMVPSWLGRLRRTAILAETGDLNGQSLWLNLIRRQAEKRCLVIVRERCLNHPVASSTDREGDLAVARAVFTRNEG
jgi:hypothetical protein